MQSGEVTVWLARWRAGQSDALEHIVPLVYAELRRVARRQLAGEVRPATLSATALVHETYLRLIDSGRSMRSIATAFSRPPG